MSYSTRLAGFPVDRAHIFYLEKARYRVGVAGVNAVCLARAIKERVNRKRSLLPLRAEIRAVRGSKCRATLAHLIECSPDSQLRLIAIWLRGLCCGYVGTSIIVRYAEDPNDRVRVAVAGALRRLSAWAILETMSMRDRADRVRRIATQRPRKKFDDKLRRFTNRVSTIPHVESAQPLYESPTLDLHSLHPPKPVAWIRQLLERIRQFVHGDPNARG